MKQNSRLMDAFLFLGLRSIAWSLRRLYCPVQAEGLVLEVGSGGNPYFRSNVLLDAYEETRERHWAPLVHDRPTVLGFVENLPFKDKSFDFVIASHVLEHSPDPAAFLNELQRVAKAGYIEVPDAFMERTNPYHDHRLEITVRNNRLLIWKKPSWVVDPNIVELYEDRVKPIITSETMRTHPFDFHVRYYWQGKIDFEVLNPDVDAAWVAPESHRSTAAKLGFRHRLGQIVLRWVRNTFSQRRRNSELDLAVLLACPSCHAGNLVFSEDRVGCDECGASYPLRNGIPMMYPPDVSKS